MEKIIFKDRKFKLWFYQVSHSEAIIRSPKTDLDKIYDINIDIYFGDIKYIEIPWMFQGLQIVKGTEDDAIYLSQKIDEDILMKNIIVLLSGGKKYYVVASIFKVMENDLDYGVLPIHALLMNKES